MLQLPTQLTVSIRLYISNPNLIDDRSNLRLIRSKLTQCNLQLRSYTANHAGTSRSSATYVALRLYPKIGYINLFPELVTGQLAINIHQTIYHIISIYFSPQQAPSIYWSSLSVITLRDHTSARLASSLFFNYWQYIQLANYLTRRVQINQVTVPLSNCVRTIGLLQEK